MDGLWGPKEMLLFEDKTCVFRYLHWGRSHHGVISFRCFFSQKFLVFLICEQQLFQSSFNSEMLSVSSVSRGSLMKSCIFFIPVASSASLDYIFNKMTPLFNVQLMRRLSLYLYNGQILIPLLSFWPAVDTACSTRSLRKSNSFSDSMHCFLHGNITLKLNCWPIALYPKKTFSASGLFTLRNEQKERKLTEILWWCCEAKIMGVSVAPV